MKATAAKAIGIDDDVATDFSDDEEGMTKLHVRLRPDMIAQVDEVARDIAKPGKDPKRSRAFRYLLRLGLKMHDVERRKR